MSEFRKLKQKVTNDRLRQDLIKDLEKSLFGNDLENIEPKDDKKKFLLHQVHQKKIILQKLMNI